MFTRCGAYEEALSSFQKSGNWRQVFCMASLLRHTDERVISLARSVAGMNSLCVPFHENAKPVIFLMITVRGIETQSISKTLSTLKKNVLSKSKFYGHCLFKNVNGTIELLCMGICGRCFRRAFSIRSSAFQRNRRKSKIVLLVASSNYQNHADGNKKIIGSLSNGDSVGNENARISKTTTLHVNHAFCTFLYRHCTTTTWKCSRFLADVSVRQSCS